MTLAWNIESHGAISNHKASWEERYISPQQVLCVWAYLYHNNILNLLAYLLSSPQDG